MKTHRSGDDDGAGPTPAQSVRVIRPAFGRLRLALAGLDNANPTNAHRGPSNPWGHKPETVRVHLLP